MYILVDSNLCLPYQQIRKTHCDKMNGKGGGGGVETYWHQQLNNKLILTEFIFLLCLVSLTVAQTYISLLHVVSTLPHRRLMNALVKYALLTENPELSI